MYVDIAYTKCIHVYTVNIIAWKNMQGLNYPILSISKGRHYINNNVDFRSWRKHLWYGIEFGKTGELPREKSS